ncbi:COG3650 family protein [Ferrimonas balearica]|uniref:COG3650 family protein n=1 Tax=Ferrimonas balearica TaxID=44012 RepID=UPI001C995BE6|nr:MliC family protein [Ferrimonas balearica]MBY5991437.1 MliC family protein [Ferrimonas balearica]
MKSLPLSLSVLLLSGCAGPASSEPDTPVPEVKPVTLVMACETLTFTARVEGERAWLFLPGETLMAERVPTASGARYQAGDTGLWLKGEEGTLLQPGQADERCRNDRRAAIWEGAKLDGMDFRGIGNEPPWILELWPEKVVLKTGYEMSQRTWPRPEPVTGERSSRFELAAGVSVTLEGKACSDSMSGEAFETTVTVTDGERTYRGCGRALH